MKQFTHIIKDEAGLHARPAGLLVKEVKKYTSKVTLHVGEKKADASRLLTIMTLGVKHGQAVLVEVSGEDEELAAAELEAFLADNV